MSTNRPLPRQYDTHRASLNYAWNKGSPLVRFVRLKEGDLRVFCSDTSTDAFDLRRVRLTDLVNAKYMLGATAI